MCSVHEYGYTNFMTKVTEVKLGRILFSSQGSDEDFLEEHKTKKKEERICFLLTISFNPFFLPPSFFVSPFQYEGLMILCDNWQHANCFMLNKK